MGSVGRVFLKAQVDEASGCWLVPPNTPTGYSTVSYRGKTTRSHRLAYEFCRGLIPDGLVIDHLCRTRNCVNPWHMEVVTSAENVMRGESPHAACAKRTHCPQGHPYSGDNLMIRSNGKRRGCRECYRRWKRESDARRREARNV